MTTTVTINKQKADWDQLTRKQKTVVGGLLAVGVGLLLTGLAGIGMILWGAVSLLAGGGAGTLITGCVLAAGTKFAGWGLEKGIDYVERKYGFMTNMLKQPPAPVVDIEVPPVGALTPLANDFNPEAAVTLGESVKAMPSIKLKQQRPSA